MGPRRFARAWLQVAFAFARPGSLRPAARLFFLKVTVLPRVWEAAPNFSPPARDSSPSLQRGPGSPGMQRAGNKSERDPRPGEPTSVHAGACKRLRGVRDSCTPSLVAAVPRKKGTNKFSSVLRILHSCLLTKQKEASTSTLVSQVVPHPPAQPPVQGTFLGGD